MAGAHHRGGGAGPHEHDRHAPGLPLLVVVCRRRPAWLGGSAPWPIPPQPASVSPSLHSLPAGADAQETMDGDLAARVFGLLRLVDAGYHTTRCACCAARCARCARGQPAASDRRLRPSSSPHPHLRHGAPRRYGEHSRQRLDLALLSFFQNFRKVYVGEQVGWQFMRTGILCGWVVG